MKLLYTPFTEDANEEIAKRILKGKRILHITPTLILERYRFRKINEILDYTLRQNEKKMVHKVYSFDNWKRVLIDNKCSQKYLTRIEILVILKRAIQNVAPQQLEWESVASNLLDLFSTFRSSGMEFYKIQSLSEDESWEMVCKIYQEFLKLTESHLEPDTCFIRGVKEYSFKEYDELVFDGPFLFFSHLHESMINRFQELGKKITFIVPYYDEGEKIQPAFNIIRKVYSNYVPFSQWEAIGFSNRSRSTYVEEVPHILFTDNVGFLDHSIEFYQFSCLEQEIMHVVKQIQNQVVKKELREVAIVSPQSRRLRPFFNEVFEQYRIEYETTENKVKQLLPLDLIKILYQSRIDWRKFEEDSYFDTIFFKRILQSNWYNSNQSIPSFEKIELFYDALPTIDDWIDQSLKLIQLYEQIDFSKYRYHPLKSVKRENLELWLFILMELKSFQDELFSHGEVTFSEHGNKLLDVIHKLKQRFSQSQNEDPFFEKTRNVIKEQIERFNDTALLPITAEEFAEVLIGLLSSDISLSQQENDEIEVQIKRSKRKNIPMITSLHNIAFAEYRFVYLTQFTQENYPSFSPDSWPCNSEMEAKILSETTRLKVNSGLEMEKLKADCARYYFLLAFLAAKDKVVITFSGNSTNIYPSPYLMEIARSVGIDLDRKPVDLLNRLKEEGILKLVSGYDAPSYQSGEKTVELTGSIVPGEILLNEIALYRLCPKRYHYTISKPEQNVFASAFQIGFYYGRKISQKAISLIAEDYKVETTSNNAKSRFTDSVIRNYVRQAMHTEREYFPVRKEIEIQAQFLAEIFTKNLIDHIFNSRWNKRVVFTTDFIREELEIPFDHRDVKVHMPLGLKLLVDGRPNVYYLDDYELFLSILEKNLDPEVDAFFKWYIQVRQKRNSKEIGMLMNDIVTQPITIKETKLCIYCPFVQNCRGYEEENKDNGSGRTV
ncbi:hypothetical protein [Thermoactinomyces sp. CICC 10521]|uniref:hypothetical protein n=1 Tax=Thermoactinomyces sp. CICC 10521 TaxID=2767426 RepID=UPI0018DBF5CB|nr:hypothetical protein [Thermoactinomyces sp. CICC 10521]MBH8608234.1 hypothetical protein [Thermoactinomyces sp. CICC 10521]